MKARGWGITQAPQEAAGADAATAEATSIEMEGKGPKVEVAVAVVFLGLVVGISVTLEALWGIRMTTLRPEGQGDLPEPSPETCFTQRKKWVKDLVHI